MRYFISDVKHSLQYVSCGNLISKDGFVHQKRTLDTNVLIMVKEGTLYIAQGDTPYSVGPNQYIFLKEKEEHFGYRASSGILSYFWVHFTTNDALIEKMNVDFLNTILSHIKEQLQICNYIMPEYGEVSLTNKASVLFNQLLDLSRQEIIYSNKMLDYALSLLIMELSQEFIEQHYNLKHNISPNVARITEWIKANYYKPISISDLANEFGYNPDYLSSLFRKSTGYSLIHYINKIRIEASKCFLTDYNFTIKEVSYSCGFSDEKYFMKTFKKMEGLTPTQYKKAFTRKKIN